MAHELGRLTDLPVIAVDDFVHDEAGGVRAAERIDTDCRAAADGSRWIIEGGNSRTYDYRAARADCLIRLNPPLWLRLWRVLRRDGWNWQLLLWTWRYDRVFGPRNQKVMAKAEGTIAVVELDGRQAIEAFLATNAQRASPHRPSA
ncbi:hypothetical protein [Devosia sp. XK-2]|uniref:hypothetical protein n=1 Tax=Devosia sp. XK-2 TaxID=3126689 RepID=UPI0030D3425D